MITPVTSAGQGSHGARLEIEPPLAPGENKVIEFRFNPTEYQLQKSNNFAEIPIPGRPSPPIQFVRGASEKLTVELLADTSDTLNDVREVYVNKIRELLNIRGESHAPPIVNFIWGKYVFRGVVENLNVTYTL